MAYNKRTWKNGDIISEQGMNNIETGISEAHDEIKTLKNNTSDNTTLIDDNSTATNKTWSSSKINSQIKEIEKNIQNIGQPTDEQVANVINQAIANGEIVAGGITSTAKTLLISILRNAVYINDQSANIDALATALASSSSGGGTEITQYTITNSLSNATSSNATVLVEANASYTTTITANEGYTLNTITVTMGATDITSTAVSGATITISAVTGNVVITVTTTATSSGGGGSTGGGLVTDGLVNYFDFRSATYNNSGAGGSTIIEATQGNGSLFTWANNMVIAQDDYGMSTGRPFFYNSGSVGTTDTPITGTFTVAFLSYVQKNSQLFGAWASYTNITGDIYLQPTYQNTSNSNITLARETYTTNDVPNPPGYRSIILTADESTGIAKIYVGEALAKTYTGSEYENFSKWIVTGVGVTQKDVVKQTTMIVYDRVLSDAEVVDTVDFFRTLEVK